MNDIKALTKVVGSRKMASLLILGFASGLPLFLTSRTLQFWMQDAKIDIGVITLFGLVGLPYSLKFLWSPLLDRFSLPFLDSRRGWVLLTQIGLVIAIVTLAFQQPAQDVQILQFLAFNTIIIAFFSATQDIAGDSYRTDVLNKLELETGASLWVLGYRLALFITLSLAPALAEFIPWNGVYLLMAAIMSTGIIATLIAPAIPRTNQPSHSAISIKDVGIVIAIISLIFGLLFWVMGDPCLDTARQCTPYESRLFQFYWILAAVLVGWIALSLLAPKPRVSEHAEEKAPQSLQDAVVLPMQEFFHRCGLTQASLILIFILLYKLGDSLVGITGNLFLREINFTKIELGAIQGGMGFIATTVGVLVGGVILSRIGINKALWIFGILQLLSNLGYYALALAGRKDFTLLILAINIENFCAGLVTVVTVAYLMSLCNNNFTTTQFALFSSLMAISRDILSAPAGQLAKATGWPTFFLLTLVAALPGLLLLPVIAPWERNKLAIISRPGLDEEEI
ncbi:MAG: AmpG family muropeptide MFS transporter [Calothrix sp. C42_A2020_038]|nr:AmpG family muropeptide MFS transporter [Calothrix sp. C42_A2020_038]